MQIFWFASVCKYLYIASVFIFVINYSVFAQNRTLTYAELIEELRAKKDQRHLVFENVTVIVQDLDTPTINANVVINAPVTFKNLTVVRSEQSIEKNTYNKEIFGYLAFKGITFKDSLEFNTFRAAGISFDSCGINGVRIYGDNETKNPADDNRFISFANSSIYKCIIIGGINLSGLDIRDSKLIMDHNKKGSDSSYQAAVILVQTARKDSQDRSTCHINIYNTSITYAENRKYTPDDAMTLSKMVIFGVKDVTIEKSVISIPIEFYNIDDFDYISDYYIKNTIFNHLVSFKGLNLRNLSVLKCKFNAPFAIGSTITFPPMAQLRFHQFQGQLAVLTSGDARDTVYQALTPADFRNEEAYYRLIARYKALHSHYQSLGDIESANACYREMKHKEGGYLAYQYSQHPTLKNYFGLKMNHFLDTFCGYATDPVLALVYSFYVVLCFGLAYLIFPSDEDNLSRGRWLAFWQNWLHYFRSHQTRTAAFSRRTRADLRGLIRYRQALDAARKETPRFFQWLGRPYYYFSLLVYQINLFWIRQTDVLPGVWAEQPKRKQFALLVWAWAELLGFIGWGVTMRCLNALALSLNAFVTLGYGEIQAKGVARYLAVLEGLIGWFLLSIFTVSLVGQILQ